MAFTMITVTHQFKNLDGSAASGQVIFRLSGLITNGGQSYDDKISYSAQLDSNGNLSATLPANNDPATIPANSYYNVTFLLNGVNSSSGGIGQSQMIQIPYNAPGGTIDLGSLLPQVSGDGQ